MNLVLLVLESFYACANTPSMETKLSVAGLVYFFDINKVYLPTYFFFLFLATISSFGPRPPFWPLQGDHHGVHPTHVFRVLVG